MAENDTDIEVYGRVTGPGGREVRGARVVVFWQHIRTRQQLASTETDREGRYRCRFEAPAHPLGKVLLVVEARGEDLPGPLESPLVEAQPSVRVDLQAEAVDESEWGVLLRSVRPLLDGLELTDLVESEQHHDLSFLARELGQDAETFMRVAVAARLAAAHQAVPAAAFYAFLRQRVPAALPVPLLEASQDFTLIDPLIRRVASLIFALDPTAQQTTLASAIAKGLIPAQLSEQLDAIVRALQAERASDTLSQPYLLGKASLGQLLATAQLSAGKQQLFAQVLAANQQSMRNFWRTLGDGEHGFTGAEASSIQRTLSVGAFVKNHLPMVQALLQRFDSGELTSLHDLARLSQQDWTDLVRQVGPPASIDGAGPADAAEVFARVVYTRVTRAYPTAALSTRLGSFTAQGQRPAVERFFANNADLELVKHTISTWLEQKGDAAWAGIEPAARPAVVAAAKGMQRVLRVTANVDSAQALLAQGIHSATQIAGMGRQRFFLQATAAGLTKPQANRAFDAAAQRYAGVVSLYTGLNRDAIGIWPAALGSTADLDRPTAQAVERDQSLATLFGSQDFCRVDSCTSVLSPAAYLCDLLLWLRNHPLAGPFVNALAAFDARRADVRHLKLNCPNSETPLPYIDLVIEILADAISPPADPNSTINPPWKQTSADKTAAQLRAAPEYFNADAFGVLFGASYPHTLPYSAGLDALRTCLQQSGVQLWQLREALLPLHAPLVAARAAVAGERLGMTARDLSIVATPAFLTADVAWNVPAPQDPSAALVPVPAFLRAARVSYDDLLTLLEVSWVKGDIDFRLTGVGDTCDTRAQSLAPAPLDAGLLDRAHRFLRLWRRSGYLMWELDLLLRAPAVGNGALDEAALAALQVFRELQDATGLSVDQQLAFFQSADVQSHRDPDGSATISLYARVYLNPAVTAAHPDADLAAVAAGTPPSDDNLAHHLPAIQAALGISGTDATALFTVFALDAAGTLTLANLTLLLRVTLLGRAARLGQTDLVSVAKLLAPGGSVSAALTAIFATPAAALTFLRQSKAIQQSGFTIDALVYLLTPPPWTTTTGLTDAGISAVLGAVRAAVLNPSGGDVNGSVIAAVAAQLGLANDVTAFLMQPPAGQLVQLSVAGRTLISLLTDPSITSPPGGPYPPLDRAGYPSQFLAIQLLDKVGLVIKRLHLVLADLTWLFSNAAGYGGVDLTQLPVGAAQPALGAAPLLATVLLVKLARLFTSAPPVSAVQTLYDVIGGISGGTIVNEASAQAALATITGWQVGDIAALATARGFTFPADYLVATSYDGLRTLMAMAGATGGSGTQLVGWAAPPASEADAQTAAASALGALRALHPDSNEWLQLAPRMMDPIRERRSAALQDYLIATRDGAGNLVYGDVNGLFDHYLIDTQMSSCEVSTRVVQAYIAVQIFVERCLMNLELPGVTVDPGSDDTWDAWPWMKRYRIWEANRKVFLYPENWLVEAQRPSRTESFEKAEQEVHQDENTLDFLETVASSYIDRLDEVSHLLVTGTCDDPKNASDVHVVGRTQAEPPRFYLRSRIDGAWDGWKQVPLDIKAHQVVPAMYRQRLCLFWLEVKVSNEPHQDVPAAQQSAEPPSQEVAKYATLTLYFSIFRNGSWSPAQATRGKLFDKPPLDSTTVSDVKAVEALYTIKVQNAAAAPGFGTSLHVDVFRLGKYQVLPLAQITGFLPDIITGVDQSAATHLGRAVFDGRFSDLELRTIEVPSTPFTGTGLSVATSLILHAQQTYGPDAATVLPMTDTQADPDLVNEPGLVNQAGALATRPPSPTGGADQRLQLNFTSVGALEQNVGPLLNTAPVPFRVVGTVSDLTFDPSSHFFYQDARRSYFVEPQKLYWTGSAWSPVVPSDPGSTPFELRFLFRRFYHPFTRLFWHQLGSGGFELLYDRNLQLNPDQVDPSGTDAFAFRPFYQPVLSRVGWEEENGQDREFLDFTSGASFAVYNWELFFHLPLYLAERLSQNQKFEDALKWFHFIFDPTRAGTDPAPKRFWIPKPLYNLTSADILAERINNLLGMVNQGDPAAVAQVTRWRKDPFNPFLLADLRPVAYMKRAVMSYLDNLIAWADNLYSTDSREALNEATLLYVIAAEILGPTPVAITPPKHADDSYDELEPKLDTFANALVDIENVVGGGGGGGGGGGMPAPQTFYFKIPPNEKLLGYWTTVADRLFKLHHCQNIQGVTRQLALFDAPIDPGLLVKARAAGVDIGSVLSDLAAPLPGYRFTALYPIASDFVNAVRAYGALLLAALEKSDAAQLSMLTANNQLQLLRDGDQIFEWQVEQAQNAIDVLQQNIALSKQKASYALDQSLNYPNTAESVAISLNTSSLVINSSSAIAYAIAAGSHLVPFFTFGASGFGGTPQANASGGGKPFGDSFEAGAQATKAIADTIDKTAQLCKDIGKYQHSADDQFEKWVEAQMDVDRQTTQLEALQLALQIAQQNQANHQTQIDQLQQQIDFLTDKFTDQELYDWMAGQLADTYFQSYRLAYRICKQAERCYQFELGVPDSNFIQFGYWDSRRKGLLAGEALNHDLRRMQSSYFDQNKRRLELSRFVSLGALDPDALVRLLQTGACDFDLPESLFDNDYPGHYQRRLLRMSVTVVYPSPGKFDNVKGTLTMVANKVRMKPDATSKDDYAEAPVGADARFVYQYAAAPQKIVLGNGQDDPGLFLTALNNNLSDQRYLPFENAGAVSSWHFEMPPSTNEIDLSAVSDVVLHLYYSALESDTLQGFVQAYNADNQPTTGVKVFSARNDFAAPAATDAVQFPLSPWDSLFSPAAATDQTLVLTLSALKFPTWTRGKTMTVTGITAMTVSWIPDAFVVEPQTPLTAADVTLTHVPGTIAPSLCQGPLGVPANLQPGKAWTFKIRTAGAGDFRSLRKSDIGDLLLLVAFQVS